MQSEGGASTPFSAGNVHLSPLGAAAQHSIWGRDLTSEGDALIPSEADHQRNVSGTSGSNIPTVVNHAIMLDTAQNDALYGAPRNPLFETGSTAADEPM